MSKTWKKLLALCLSVLMVLGTFAACGNAGTTPTTPTTEAGPTEPAEEAKALKILTIGHSLSVDCGNTLNRIFAVEGTGDYEEVVIGTLYHSGCPLYKHVKHLQENSPQYNLYLSSSKTPDQEPTIMKSVTMYNALRSDYWDIIIMQGGVFEIGESETYTNGNIQTVQNYVNENKLNPNAIFAWHMPWAIPVDNTLRDMFPNEPNTYYTNYEKYGSNRTTFYNAITKCVGDHIVTDETFEFLIPSGTAFENALSSFLEETDIHRDYAHASSYGRVIASYVWYCSIMGIEEIKEVKLVDVPANFLKNPTDNQPFVLTDVQKEILIESVNNALANPLQMTQSQYTEAPTE